MALCIVILSVLPGVLISQQCQVTLLSGESHPELTLYGLHKDSLTALKPDGDSLRIDLNDIRTIDVNTTRSFSQMAVVTLKATVVGGTIGLVAGLVFAEVALRWLSKEENPKGWIGNEDVSGGDMLIVKLCTEMSVTIGLLHGFDWAKDRWNQVESHDLSQMTVEQKAQKISAILSSRHQ